jgi:hypothetical protein
MLRRQTLIRKLLVYGICCAFACLTYPRKTAAEKPVLEGVGTSEEAAAPELTRAANDTYTLAGWQPSVAFLASSARADTTELEFPEDEEGKHLVRDIGIFIIVSAFVAYFIIKVFLEGDKEEPPPPENGKEIP